MSGTVIADWPKFPCGADKRPLTGRGFHDARRDISDDGWPLMGVPTGGMSGVDCVDLGPEGLGWYDLEFDALPLTRSHQTPRGLHLLFKHSAGLRCSTNKIAKGCAHYLLTRNSRIEEDLIDQLFNSSEKRLARLSPIAHDPCRISRHPAGGPAR
jgi:hypothetical protein